MFILEWGKTDYIRKCADNTAVLQSIILFENLQKNNKNYSGLITFSVLFEILQITQERILIIRFFQELMCDNAVIFYIQFFKHLFNVN